MLALPAEGLEKMRFSSVLRADSDGENQRTGSGLVLSSG